jgi:arabinofuranosyltransferase
VSAGSRAAGRRSHRDGRSAPAPATPSQALALVLGLAAVALAVVMAARSAWVCDDAFISFRYAENLVRGLGLVFNAGERVEGYTNFLWTLWVALGLRLGADAEGWSVAWGVVCYGAAIALLAHHAVRRARRSGSAFVLPVAALLGAAHLDWQRFATSGLETSLFTTLLILGYLLLLSPSASLASAGAAGGVLALATMTRPEGMLFAVLGGAFLLATRGSRWRSFALFGAGYLLLWGPFVLWRVAYYGDFFPNTFYAKSGDRAWWGQGWTYARLYFTRYWVAGAALPAAAVSLWRARPRRTGPASPAYRARVQEAVLAAAFALGLLLYVVRVGGDFMFARMIIPVTPFLFVLLELALEPQSARRPAAAALVAAGALAATWWAPDPLPEGEFVSGITNEWAYYPKSKTDEQRRSAFELRRYFAGLPVCVAFFGSEARLVYYADPAVAVESEAGLTDRWLAHQPLAQRGRVGHEKHAPLDYLVGRRGAHVVFHPLAAAYLGLPERIPLVPVDFSGTRGLLLHWDPSLMAEWKRRGATFDDFPGRLDGVLATVARRPGGEVRTAYDRLKLFYFDFVPDSARQRPFLERLAATSD